MKMTNDTATPLPVHLLARNNADAERVAAEAGLKSSIWRDLDDFIPAAREQVRIDWPESVFMRFGLWPWHE